VELEWVHCSVVRYPQPPESICQEMLYEAESVRPRFPFEVEAIGLL